MSVAPNSKSCYDDRTHSVMDTNEPPIRVVYLFGAGASHACAQSVGSRHGLLMSHLNPPLAIEINKLIQSKYAEHRNLYDLVNTIVDEDTDFEHIITFLDNAPSLLHRRFANDLRRIFEEVLRSRLTEVQESAGGNPTSLYSALFDLHNLPGNTETIQGILTTNYDSYVEEGLGAAGFSSVDLGFRRDTSITPSTPSPPQSVTLLKLHGSFDWQDTWPITTGGDGAPLWIPLRMSSGIQKDKQRYPFNVIWGIAREVLACDVLRIIGCRLDGNDWDLISLLFTSIHVQSTYTPYTVEVIDSPQRAMELNEALPYLNAKSILELVDIGPQLVSEWSGGAPRSFGELNEDEQGRLLILAGRSRNWFEIWLRQRAEFLYGELGTLSTAAGSIQRFLEQ